MKVLRSTMKALLLKTVNFNTFKSCFKRFQHASMHAVVSRLNPLEFTGNYSATSNNMKLVHWPLMGGLLHLVQ